MVQTVLNTESLSQIMHGGLFSEDGVTLEDLRKIDRNRQPPDAGRFDLQTHWLYTIPIGKNRFNTFLHSLTGPMCDLLWSDPQPQVSSHQSHVSLGHFDWSCLFKFYPILLFC